MNNSKRRNRRAGIQVGATVDDPPEDVRPAKTRLQEIRENAEADEEMRIMDILASENANGGMVHLYRRGVSDTDYRRIGKIASENFSFDVVQATYGGGDYKAQIMNSQGKFVKAVYFGIDLMIPSKHPQQQQERHEPADANSLIKTLQAAGLVGKQGGADQNTAILLAMIESSERRNEALMRMLATNRPQATAADTLLPILVEKMFAQKSTPLKELMESVAMMRKFQAGELPDADDEKSKTGLDRMFDNIGKIAGPVVEHLVMQRLGNGEVAPALPAPGAAPQAAAAHPAAAETASSPEPAMNEKFLLQLFRSQAIAAAERRRDPFQFAESSFDMVPVASRGRVFDAANDQNWFANIFAADPRAGRHVEFLTNVRHAVLVIAFREYALQGANKNDANVTPAAFAAEFLKWASPEFHDALADFCADAESFADIFGADAENPWIAQLPAAVAELLPAELEPAPPQPPERKPAARKK